MSDCGAVGGGAKGAIESLTAGTDLECNPWGQSLYPSLVNSTLAGNVSAAAIAQAAERMLYVRIRLGAFDDPATVPFADKSKVRAPLIRDPVSFSFISIFINLADGTNTVCCKWCSC